MNPLPKLERNAVSRYIWVTCIYPDGPEETSIEGWGLPKSEQFWRRKSLPDIFNHVEVDKDGNAILTPQQSGMPFRK